MQAPALDNEFLCEVRTGLSGFGQKTLPCRYFYDAVGSALFEAITYLAEYGLTRADARILQAHAAEITAHLPGRLTVAELGSGSGTKTRPVLESLRGRQPVSYFPIDVSATALELCARELEPIAEVTPIEASYLEGMEEVRSRRRPGDKLVGPVPRQHHRQFRTGRGGRVPQFLAFPALPRRRPAARHRPGEIHRPSAGSLRRCGRRHRGLQPQSARPYQSRIGRRFQPPPLPPRSPLPGRSTAYRDAPALPQPANGPHRQSGTWRWISR